MMNDSIRIMTDDELNVSLKRIGKSAFVRYFQELSQGHDAMLHGEFEAAGVGIRMSYAGRIFRAGRERDALQIIVRSVKVPMQVRNQARELLSEMA